MASDLNLLCYKAGGSALCYKAGGNSLIYKWRREGGGGGEGQSTRRIVISVSWNPINWTCEDPENHLMEGYIRCEVSLGVAALISSDTSNIGENTFRYEITEFPAQFRVSMGFGAACVHQKYPEVTAIVAANCRDSALAETKVNVPQSGYASKNAVVAVGLDGRVTITVDS